MGLLSYFKENKKLKKQVNDLEFSIRSNRVMLNNMQHRHDEEIREKDTLIESLNSKIESLNSKIDILHKYYDIDKEPTQEVKTAMRIDERIHDLELENIRLNSYISCLSLIDQNQQNIYQRYNMLGRINYPNGGIIYV